MLAQALTLIAASLLLVQFVALDPDSCERGSKEDCHDSDFKFVQTFREGCPIMLSDVKCAHRKQKEIKEWLKKHNRFKILVTGKTGTGKTTFVKGLKENYVPEEDHLLPHTVKVTPYEHQQDKVDFIFYDTPGLKDTVSGSNDYSYLADMINNNEEPDLIIFTLKMDDDNFREEDMGAIVNITHAFGWKIWRNAMFVLTFANKVSKPGCSAKSRENKAYYAETKSKFSLRVTEILLENNVQEDVANSIPVIPVGLVSHGIIEADDRELSWVVEFWSNLHKVLKSSRQEEMGAQVEETQCCPCQKPSSSSEISCSMATVVVVSLVAILLPLAALEEY